MRPSPRARTASWAFLKDLRDSGGKFAPTPVELTPQRSKDRLPQVTVESRDGSEASLRELVFHDAPHSHRAALIGVISRAYGQRMLSAWMEPFIRMHCVRSDDDAPDRSMPASPARALQLNVVESATARFVPGFKRMLRNRASCPSGAEPFFCFKQPQEAASELGLANPLSAAMLLVDSDCYIRWKASGFPRDEEIERMHKCVQMLTENETQ